MKVAGNGGQAPANAHKENPALPAIASTTIPAGFSYFEGSFFQSHPRRNHASRAQPGKHERVEHRSNASWQWKKKMA